MYINIYIYISVYIYIYVCVHYSWPCKLTLIVQTFTSPTFHMTQYSLDGPLTEACIHLTNLSLDKVFI